MTDRQTLRQQMRDRRRRLTASAQRRAARSVARHLCRHPWFLRARHIGAYLANDGEIDLGPVLGIARERGKQLYLPRLDQRQLVFERVRPDDRLVTNRFGIAEPRPALRRHLKPPALNLVLMPLVAFDGGGNRLGMGGGFYDRTFAWKQAQPRADSPRLVGVAHAFQEVPTLEAASWDVPLDAVVTDRGWVTLTDQD